MAPTRTAPGRAGRTCRRGSSRTGTRWAPAVEARRTSAAGSEDPEAATAGGRRRDAQRPVLRAAEGRRWRGAVDNMQSARASANSRRSHPGDSRPGEEGTQETRPQETWRRKGPGQHPGVGQTGTSMGARKKSESKVKVFRIGLESEGAAKDTAHMPLQKLPTRNACNVSTTLARVNSQSLSCKRHDGATTVQICAICR